MTAPVLGSGPTHPTPTHPTPTGPGQPDPPARTPALPADRLTPEQWIDRIRKASGDTGRLLYVVEQVYAQGYHTGFGHGYDDGRCDAQRAYRRAAA